MSFHFFSRERAPGTTDKDRALERIQGDDTLVALAKQIDYLRQEEVANQPNPVLKGVEMEFTNALRVKNIVLSPEDLEWLRIQLAKS